MKNIIKEKEDDNCYFFVGDVNSAETMTPIGKLQGDIDELKNVKPGDVLRLYEETTWYKWWPE